MSEDQFEKLARMIKEAHDDLVDRVDGNAAELKEMMEQGFADADQRIEHMEKKADTGFANIEQEMSSIRAELRDMRRRLEIIEEHIGLQSGYAKELDELRKRMSALEKRVASKTAR